MKSVFRHPEPGRAEQTGPRYWRSLDALAQKPEFRAYLEREFPEGASELDDVDRRHFMKIMAASFALGGLTLSGCRRPEAKILAYAKTPENTIPGLPLFFATAFPLRGSATPVVVETHQGRPTKIEGNPSYAPFGGATGMMEQASVLELYDPDRSTAHKHAGAIAPEAQVRDFLAGIPAQFAAAQGAGLAFLAGHSSSPTRRRLVAALEARLPQAIWAEYEPLDATAPERAATALAGRPAKLHYRFAAAQRIVAVDADFVGAEEGSLQFSREFTAGRRVEKPGDPMNRLYAIESALTLAGAMADHRLRLATGQMVAFLAQLAQAVGVSGQPAIARLAAAKPAPEAWVAACARDLLEHRGGSLVMAGSHLPEAAHAIALLINDALGNLGRSVLVLESEPREAAGLRELAATIRSGGVRTLFILGGNPAYNAPADLDWPALQKSVPVVVRLGAYEDETSAGAAWHLSAAHYLESWGDARTADGTVVPVQPMILPLFGGISEIEVLARILGEQTPDGHAQVLATFTALTGASGPAGEKAFQTFLHEGLLEGSEHRPLSGSIDRAAAARLIEEAPAPVAPGSDALEVRFVGDAKVDDGRFANNGWLQECPEPMTKLTWDNAIIVSPKLAAAHGIVAKDAALQIVRKNPNTFERGREVAHYARITLGGRTITGPVHIQPGLADFTVVLPLGYGRDPKRSGRIASGAGFNAYTLRTSEAPYAAQGARFEVVDAETYQLANTQEHWSMEGRAIVREANLEGENGFEHNPEFVKELGAEAHTPPVYGLATGMPLDERAAETPRGNSLYAHPNYDGVHQWGMTIDLNTCTGCSACVVACQAENNIPIVGRDQVRRGREMHWIRIDRYFSDSSSEGGAFGGPGNSAIPEDPQVSVQPLACVHCETAPCETVCPVNATVHDEEGLNVMAYNRCIGTRYCANNCPYKVRRFNFFDYNQRQLDKLYLGPLAPKGMPELVQMAKNPDVTVRMRGVMEKCTYCVQRIQEAKIQQKVKARDTGDIVVPDGGVRTACQQACPTQAITFGNIADPESAVSKAKANPRNYELLGYLNTRTRTTYLARLRNPNPRMPDFNSLPLSRVEYEAKNPHPHHAGGGTEPSHGVPADAGHAAPGGGGHDE